MDKHLFAPYLFTLCGLILFHGGFSVNNGAEGVVLAVCSTCTYPSIFAALSAVNAPDTEIKVSGGNYTNEDSCSITFSNITLTLLGAVNVETNSTDGVWLTLSGGGKFTFRQNTLRLTGALSVAGNTTVVQDCDMFLSVPTESFWGVTLIQLQDGKWIQNGRLDMSVVPSLSEAAPSGMEVASGMVWQQNGDFALRVSGSSSITGFRLYGQWMQDGHAELSADTGNLVWMDSGSQWVGTANVKISIASEYCKGVIVRSNAVWYQATTSTLTGIAANCSSATCSVVECAGNWTQNGDVTITTSSNSKGVALVSEPVWTQNGKLVMSVTSMSTVLSIGVDGNSGASSEGFMTWIQNGAVTLNATGSGAAAVLCNPNSALKWFSSVPPVIKTALNATGIDSACVLLVLPSPSPQFILSNSTNEKSMPALRVNLTAPAAAITLLPKDSSGKEQGSAAVGLSLGTISSSATDNNSTITATVTNGTWAALENNTLGADQSFIYSCGLQFPSSDGDANATVAALGLQFFLFSNTTEVNLGGDTPVKFNVSPAFAKFTVRLTDWVWQSPDDPNERAEVRVAITPAFTGFSEVAGDEADFVREFALTGQQTTYSGRASTRVRLVEAVELDGKLVTAKEAGSNGRKAVEFTLDATSSSLVVSFARFNTSAVYDPDLGVLLTGRSGDGGGGSSDNTGLIIGVAVAVPLAVLLVLVVIVSAVAITYWRKKQQVNIAAEAAINFNPDDGL